MNMNFDLQLTQEQKLVLTQQMQISLEVLQMSTYELQQYVDQIVQENPILENKEAGVENEEIQQDNINMKKFLEELSTPSYSENSYSAMAEEEVSPFYFLSTKQSLKEFLKEQLLGIQEETKIKNICEYIIENLDQRGYLGISLDMLSQELKVSYKEMERGLQLVQSLDPIGVGARNIQECLKIQIKQKHIEDPTLNKIVEHYLPLIADNKYQAIGKKLNISVKKAQYYGDLIKSLEPKPARGFHTGEVTKYVIPDAYIRNIGEEYYIIMNEEIIPHVTINPFYKEMLQREKNEEITTYIKEKLNQAIWLIKSIYNRKSTMRRVLEEILKIQRAYFQYGEDYLQPMTLKQIAEALGVHESTISRTIRGKYISTGKGTIEIRKLFNTGISFTQGEEEILAQKIKEEIKEIICREDKRKPLSDQAICERLNNSAMNISRRTVAKYRQEIGIKAASKRKRF